MKTRLLLLLAILTIATACRREVGPNRRVADYDVVDEGSASGVSSGVTAPGETSAPSLTVGVSPIGADTTTNFTLIDPIPATPTTTEPALPGSLLPLPLPSAPQPGEISRPPRPAPRPQPVPTPPPTTTPAPPPEPAPEEPVGVEEPPEPEEIPPPPPASEPSEPEPPPPQSH